jgi:hypothetical protein
LHLSQKIQKYLFSGSGASEKFTKPVASGALEKYKINLSQMEPLIFLKPVASGAPEYRKTCLKRSL